MRRTVRALMAGTSPSATAWRARSALDQWVMCNPRATGPRQASWTMRNQSRGGKPGRPARPHRAGQQAGQPFGLIEPTGAPDGVGVALHPGRDLAGPLPGRDGQDGPGPADLEPGGGLAASEVLQDGAV